MFGNCIHNDLGGDYSKIVLTHCVKWKCVKSRFDNGQVAVEACIVVIKYVWWQSLIEMIHTYAL